MDSIYGITNSKDSNLNKKKNIFLNYNSKINFWIIIQCNLLIKVNPLITSCGGFTKKDLIKLQGNMNYTALLKASKS